MQCSCSDLLSPQRRWSMTNLFIWTFIFIITLSLNGSYWPNFQTTVEVISPLTSLTHLLCPLLLTEQARAEALSTLILSLDINFVFHKTVPSRSFYLTKHTQLFGEGSGSKEEQTLYGLWHSWKYSLKLKPVGHSYVSATTFLPEMCISWPSNNCSDQVSKPAAWITRGYERASLQTSAAPPKAVSPSLSMWQRSSSPPSPGLLASTQQALHKETISTILVLRSHKGARMGRATQVSEEQPRGLARGHTKHVQTFRSHGCHNLSRALGKVLRIWMALAIAGLLLSSPVPRPNLERKVYGGSL